MDKKSFMKSGHLPTLFSAFLYFDVSFMVWVLFGPMTPFIADQMHLSATQKGLLTAIPLLGGSFFRPILGLLADHIGGRRAGLTGLVAYIDPFDFGMALREHALASLSHRLSFGHRRREFRGCVAAGWPLVSCRAPGIGDGNRRRR